MRLYRCGWCRIKTQETRNKNIFCENGSNIGMAEKQQKKMQIMVEEMRVTIDNQLERVDIGDSPFLFLDHYSHIVSIVFLPSLL